jgi:hypothetical protein
VRFVVILAPSPFRRLLVNLSLARTGPAAPAGAGQALGELLRVVSRRVTANPIRAVVCWWPNLFGPRDPLEAFFVLSRLYDAGVHLIVTRNGTKNLTRFEDRLGVVLALSLRGDNS